MWVLLQFIVVFDGFIAVMVPFGGFYCSLVCFGV